MEMDSKLSISDLLDVGGAIRLVKQNKGRGQKFEQMDSSIGSLIGEEEREQLRNDEMYNEIDVDAEMGVRRIAEQDIEQIVSEMEKRWMQDEEMYLKLGKE